MTPIRVALVDDHAVVREGLERLLSEYDDVEIVGSVDGGRAAVALCADVKPDVILMDLSMPDMDGVEATGRVLVESPGTRVIALTGYLDEETLRGVLAAGASGYLLKSVSGDDLAAAVRAAGAGRATISLEALPHVSTTTASRAEPLLTSREQDVLVRLAEGLSNKAIASQLSLSAGTIRTHVSHILAKLGVENRTAAARYALRVGLVQDPSD